MNNSISIKLFFRINFTIMIIFLFSAIIGNSYLNISNAKYPILKVLNSGNYFIILQKGIYIFNTDLTLNKSIYNFTIDEIRNETDLTKCGISEYIDNENNHYILYLLKALYIFIYKDEDEFINKFEINIDEKGYYYDIIPIKYHDNKFETIICFMNNKNNFNQLNFYLYKFNLLNNLPDKISSSLYKDERECNVVVGQKENFDFITNYSFSCQKNYDNILLCFYGAHKSCYVEKDILYLVALNINEGFAKIELFNSDYFLFNTNNFIKSAFSNENHNIFVCYTIETETQCIITSNKDDILYDNEILHFDEICSKFEPYFFDETNEYICICYINNNGKNTFRIIKTDNDFNEIKNTTILLNECSEVNTFSLFYHKINKDYGIISDCHKINESEVWDIIYNFSIFNYIPNSISDSISDISYSSTISTEPSIISTESFTFDILSDTSKNADILSTLDFIEIDNMILSDTSKNTDILSTLDFIEMDNMILSDISLNENISSTFLLSDNIISYILPDFSTHNFSSLIYDIFDSIKNNTDIKEEDIEKNLPKILNNIEVGKNYEMSGEDFTLSIKPINSTFLVNSTHVNFSNCENVLRKAYNISSNRILTFLQMEIYNKNEQSLVNKVEYQVYDDNKKLLDLSLCEDSNIQIFYALKENNLDIDTISNFQKSNIDIFNINDSFFNDICQSFSFSNNDIILEDRVKEIYQNYSLCDDGCTYNEIDLKNKLISCDCKVKTNISTNESYMNLKQFNEINIESNFGIIKCYKLVFSLNGKINNIAFWIFTILILINFILLLYYFCKDLNKIKEYIINEMVKNGYINESKKDIILNGAHNVNNVLKKLFPPKKKLKILGKDDEKYFKINKKKNNDSSSLNNIKSSVRETINQNNSNLFENKTNEKDINIITSQSNNKTILNKNIRNTRKAIFKTMKANKIERINKENDEKKRKRKLYTSIQIKNSKIIKNNIGSVKPQVIKEDKDDNLNNFNIIYINLNNTKECKPKNSNMILNNYTFEEAIKYDMRSIFMILYIFLLSKQAIFHAFLFRSPLQTFPLRFSFLIFIFSSDLALNAIFYLDDKISKKYKLAQNLILFTFNNNITIILLSTLIGFIFMALFTYLANSINNIRDVFRKEEEKIKINNKYKPTEKRKTEILKEIESILKNHKKRVIALTLIETILILFFWYYSTAFCHVYSNTQYSWLLDSFLSMLSRFILEFIFSLGFAKLYRISVSSNAQCLYNFVMFLYKFA